MRPSQLNRRRTRQIEYRRRLQVVVGLCFMGDSPLPPSHEKRIIGSAKALPYPDWLAENISDVMDLGHFCHRHRQGAGAECLEPARMLRNKATDLVHDGGVLVVDVLGELLHLLG